MIYRLIKFWLITFVLLILLTGYSCQSLPWVERDELFHTIDLTRAQEEIPFTIITPDYIPMIRGDIRYPGITGTLKEYQINGKAGIDITYFTKYDKESFIEIEEYNFPVTSGDPEINPGLEIVNMYNIEVVRSVSEYDTYFCFNKDEVYYLLHFQYVPLDEAEKVLESMLKQL